MNKSELIKKVETLEKRNEDLTRVFTDTAICLAATSKVVKAAEYYVMVENSSEHFQILEDALRDYREQCVK
jgi:hypothetical protein